MQTPIWLSTCRGLPGWSAPRQGKVNVSATPNASYNPNQPCFNKGQRGTGRYGSNSSSSSSSSSNTTSRGSAITTCGPLVQALVDRSLIQHDLEDVAHQEQQQQDAQSSMSGAAAVSRRTLATATAAALAWGGTGLPAWALRTVSTCKPAGAH
jgi:hypothetical protein